MDRRHVKNDTRKKRKRQASPAATQFDAVDRVAEGSVANLPCLYSNNSTEPFRADLSDKHTLETIQALCGLLSPYYKRAAHTLHSNVARLISQAPSINHVGFLTLTFGDNVTDHREAYNRFRSFNTHYLSSHPDFKDWISVKERQTRGAWHYHLLVILNHDIRTGLDFEQIKNRNYSSANENLKRYWKDLRENLSNYGLGRSELLPIRSNEQAMSRYLGKYISKHLGNREEQDRGVRLVNYSRGWSRNSIRFAWYTENSVEWRRKLSLFAHSQGCTEFYQLTDKLGPGWAYRFATDIMNIDETLTAAGGVLQPAHHDRALTRISQKKDILAASKQRAKDDERFRSWEREMTYQESRSNHRTQARINVVKAMNKWTSDPDRKEKDDEIADMVKVYLETKDGPPAPF